MKNFISTNKCRISNDPVENILSLGVQPLANSLKKNKNDDELKIKLSISYCKKSSLLQLDQTVNKNILFDKYVWVTGTGQSTRAYAEVFYKQINKIIFLKKNDLIIEIASNDGTFLKPFLNKGYKNVIGIDPAKNIAKIANKNNIKTLNNYWSFSYSKNICKKYGNPKFIFARNVIPHVSNLKSVIKGISFSLDYNGIGAIEFHDAGEILKKLQYDSIYHEHLCYFSVKSITYLLKQHNLYPFHLIESPINAGNKLIIFSKKKKILSNDLKKAKKNEVISKVNNFNSWKIFAKKSYQHRDMIKKLISKFQNKRIIGFGSSARSQTFLNFCELDSKYIDAIIDNNNFKQGLYTPGTNIPIVNFKKGMQLKPDLILVLAWNFKNEIFESCKSAGFQGKFIIPFPNKPYLKK